MKLAVFASTRGTDLQAVIDAIKNGELERIELSFVLSNNKDCYALERARQQGFLTFYISSKGKTREEYDALCLELLKKHEVDLVFLIGYMRILSEGFVRVYKDKILNVHPSLLPSFPGMDMDVHAAVLSYGCKITGCTVHLVDAGTDTGPIVIQRAVAIAESETADTLKEKVQAEERIAVIDVLRLFRDNRVAVEGRRVVFRPVPDG